MGSGSPVNIEKKGFFSYNKYRFLMQKDEKMRNRLFFNHKKEPAFFDMILFTELTNNPLKNKHFLDALRSKDTALSQRD